MKSLMVSAAVVTAMAVVVPPASARPAPPAGPAQERGDSAGNSTLLKPPETGEQVYRQVCQACHMADGKGGTGAATIPALAGNPRLASPAYPIMLVVRGRGAMPSLTDLLGPPQIAAVATYVRTHFGNSYTAPVTVEEVKPFLPARK